MLNNKRTYQLNCIVLLSISVLAFSGVYVVRGLHGDGSFYILTMLVNNGFTSGEPARDFVLKLTQFPAAWAMKLGIQNLNFIIRLHSLGLIVVPLLFWLAALANLIRSNTFGFFLIAFAATYLSSGFFANGEYTLTYSMVAFYASILFKEKINTRFCLLITLTAFALIRSYEAMIFLGPALILLTTIRAFSEKNRDWMLNIACSLSCLFLISSIFIAARSILKPHSPGNLSGAIDFIPMIQKGQFIYLVCFVLLATIGYRIQNIRFNFILKILTAGTAILFIINTNWWLTPEQHYRFRTISGLFLFTLILISTFFVFIKKYDAKALNQSLTIVSTAIFFTLYFPFVSYDIGYYKWSKTFEFEAINLTESIHIEKTKIYENENAKWDSGFNWPWSNPTLSILLRGKGDVMILNHTNYSGWEPNLNMFGHNPLNRYHRSSGLYGNHL